VNPVNQVQNISLQHNHPEDPDMCNILRAVQARITTIVDKRLLYTNIPLDGRSAIIRTAETNLGSLLADAVRAYYNTNIAFINSGSVRCDRIIPAGEMTVKDVIG
jgi:5'-nucleotidase